MQKYLLSIKYTFSASILLFILGTGCKKYDYKNPVDPEYEIAPPAAINIRAVKDNKIVIDWAPASLASFYEIKRKKNSEAEYTVLDSVNAYKTGFIDYSGVETDVAYTYGFTAMADQNISETVTRDFILPFPAPSNLELSMVGKRLIKLTWKNNAFFAIWTRVEKQTASGSFEVIGQPGRSKNEFFDSFTQYDTTYNYRVVSITSINASAYSEIVGFTPSRPDTADNANFLNPTHNSVRRILISGGNSHVNRD
ncbi:MAG: hypothetical protein DWQ05_00495 [Calditrichaeota bacterium]|nr:MAG: hypothetical protein DWQ05_00495 [Calditrichota bacterium]